MHEASLMKDLLHKIETIALKQGAKRVVGLKVRLGALSHMSPEHFQEHFDQISPGTVAEGARISSEVLTDLDDPRAQEIILESVEIED